MNQKIFGRKTGLRASEMVLGTGSFGTRWGHGAQPEEARRIFDRYVEAGGNFIDTADGYQLGESEEILSDLIRSERDRLVLASKYSVGGKGLLDNGNSRKNMIHAVEASLKRLKTDRLDLYWAHLSDGQTPVEEILRAFDDLVSSGKILYAGFSNFPAWRIANASLLADIRGWAPVAGIQIEYNLIERNADKEFLPMAEALGLGVAFWSPLAGGTLTGKYRTADTGGESRVEKMNGFLVRGENSTRETAILDTLATIAQETGSLMQDVALAWIRQKHAATNLSTFTIIGPRTLEQLKQNMASLQLTLTPQHMEALATASDIPLGYPYEIIHKTQQRTFGAGSGHVLLKHAVA